MGGQCGERRKWIHCFEDVDAVVFVTAISEFDQLTEEEPLRNRLADSLVNHHSCACYFEANHIFPY